MRINPYLTFDGRCEEAFEHYAAILGGDIGMLVDEFGIPWMVNCSHPA